MMVDWVLIGLSASSSSSSSSILLEEWSCSSRWNALSKSETTSLQGGGKLIFIHAFACIHSPIRIHSPIHSCVHTFLCPYIQLPRHTCTCILHSLVHSLQEWDVSDGQDTLVQFHQLVQQLCKGANQNGVFTHSFHSVSFTISLTTRIILHH